jgi:hypothetical protein
MKNFKVIEKCRICGCNKLEEILSLDPQFISATFVKSNKDNKLANIKIPMTMVICLNNDCSLVQLKETTNPELLYTDYFYRSSTNDMMKNDLKKVVEKIQTHAPLNNNDIVVDIGANDCTMLQYFPIKAKRIGVEPASNIDWSDVDNTIQIINDFFPSPNFIASLNGEKVKNFTSCAMFYDLDDPNSFVRTIKENLHNDGVWCIQLSHALLMVKNMNFYDICHEHLEYYTLKTLRNLMKLHGLHLYHAELNMVNGGSLLVYITHKEKNQSDSEELIRILNEEEELGLYGPDIYKDFFIKMQSLATKVKNYLKAEIKNGNRVLGLGASTKGNVLLQFFKIDKSIIPAISERQDIKVGLKTLGSDIDLISEENARDISPSCMLVLPWYFKEEIVSREKEYIEAGGKLLFPMPYAHLVTKDGEINI